MGLEGSDRGSEAGGGARRRPPGSRGGLSLPLIKTIDPCAEPPGGLCSSQDRTEMGVWGKRRARPPRGRGHQKPSFLRIRGRAGRNLGDHVQ